MDDYLQCLGYWNLAGSILLFLLLNEVLANKILVNWAKIYIVKYKLGYYGRLWLVWAAGLNVFFSLIHIKSTNWDIIEIKQFLILFDIVIYLIFIGLGIWGYIKKKCDVGIFVALIIFSVWITWGIYVLK